MGFFSSRPQSRSSKLYHVQATPVSADALTMSLAQKLGDLATANADGLLDDEEYRLLRQNVFERYTTPFDAAAPPPQTARPPRPPRPEPPPPSSRGGGAPSIISQRSIGSTLSSLIRKATSARRDSDAVSFFSSRHPSDDSLIATTSQASHDVGSSSLASASSSRRRHRMPYPSSLSSRTTTTSRSARPPSSFRLPRTHESDQHQDNDNDDNDDDDEPPKSAADLCAEIAAVEVEGRKLLDAFNGLELTVLTKSRTSMPVGSGGGGSSRLGASPPDHPHHAPPPLVAQPVHLKRKPSVVTAITDTFKSRLELRAAATALRVGSSAAAAPPLHSSRSSPNLHRPPALPIATPPPKKRPSLLSRKPPLPPPPLPLPLPLPPPLPLPSAGGAATDDAGLSNRPAHPHDPALAALEAELGDIRRRRAEVAARYEARLAFLRAKLKTAEIRERLGRGRRA